MIIETERLRLKKSEGSALPACFTIFLKDTSDVLGFVDLSPLSVEGAEEIELQCRIFPEYENRGFGTEAAFPVCEYGLRNVASKRLIAHIRPENHKALRLAEKLGMHLWKDSIYRIETIEIKPYQTSWVERFASEKERLEKAFSGLEIELYHIGSTSIPGCFAKPIIDILGVVSDIHAVDAYNEEISKLGYLPKGEYGMRGRRYFQKRMPYSVNLHIFADTNPEVERHLRFCAYLRSRPEKIIEYSKRKSELAKRFSHDIFQYTLGKGSWIKETDRLAAEEFREPLHKKRNVLRKSLASLPEILRAMEANMHLHMTYFTQYVSSAERVFQPDVTVVRSEIPDDMFNYVLFAKFSEYTVDTRVSEIIELYKKQALPFSWWVGETDTPSGLSNALLQQGLVFKEENIGMYADCAGLEQNPPIVSLKIERVRDRNRLSDFCSVIIAIGGNSEAFDRIYSKIPEGIYGEGSSIEMYVGYVEGIPAVTGTLVLDADVAGIYYVATLPSRRKQGYGTAMTRHLIDRARTEGYRIVTLQASHEGKDLYRRLGFKECCLFTEYGYVPTPQS